MGYAQSKQEPNKNIAIAQAISENSTQFETKLNTFGIIIIVIAILLTIVVCYGIRLQCHRKIRSWLRKEAHKAVGFGTLNKVQTTQAPPTQQV